MFVRQRQPDYMIGDRVWGTEAMSNRRGVGGFCFGDKENEMTRKRTEV